MCEACLPAGYQNFLKGNLKSASIVLAASTPFLVLSLLNIDFRVFVPTNVFEKLVLAAFVAVGVIGVPMSLLMLTLNFLKLTLHRLKGTVPPKRLEKAFLGEGQRIIKSIETGGSEKVHGEFELPEYGNEERLVGDPGQNKDLHVERRWRDIVAVGKTLEEMLRALPSNWKQLWDDRRDINRVVLSEPAFIRSALAGRDADLGQMIDAGQDVNQPNDAGFTALHAAAYGGNPSSVELLCKAGADPNVESTSGVPPMRALIEGYDHKVFAKRSTVMSALPILLKYGADPNWTFPSGVGYLHVTIKKHWGDATSLLLSSGADPNARTVDGTYPIQVAAVEADVRAAKALVSAGADLDVKDPRGRSVKSLARSNLSFLRFLKSAGRS